MNAVIYARFSSSAQREESIDTQVRECKAYAEANGMTIVKIYADHAKSGRTANRPEFQRMIKESAQGLFDAVILYTIDRFARNRFDSAVYKAKLKKNGITVHYAKQPIMDEPEGIVLEALLEGYAEYYSASLARSVKAGLKENALKAHSTGGTFPLGYTVNKDGSFSIVEHEAEAVRTAFEMYADRISKTKITKALNEKGYRTRTGRPFTQNSLDYMLRNPKYCGTYRYDTVTIDDGMPSIISKELFDRVQKNLEETKVSKAHYKAKEEYLLSTKLYCGDCEQPMIGESGTSHNGTVYRYYKCISQKRKKTCDRKPVKKEWIEQLVINTVASQILTDENIEKIAEKAVEMQEHDRAENAFLKSLKAQVAEADRRIANLVKALENGIVVDLIDIRIKELREEKKRLEKEIVLEEMSNPVLTKEQIVFWLYKYKKRDAISTPYDRFIINAFVNRVYISGSGDDIEVTILVNISDHAPLRLRGSDYHDMMYQSKQYPNQLVFFPHNLLIGITVKGSI